MTTRDVDGVWTGDGAAGCSSILSPVPNISSLASVNAARSTGAKLRPAPNGLPLCHNHVVQRRPDVRRSPQQLQSGGRTQQEAVQHDVRYTLCFAKRLCRRVQLSLLRGV